MMVGERLVQLRKIFHLTQKEVSEIINVTPQTYSGYEKGKYEPSMETLVRLAFLYRTSIDNLLLKDSLPHDSTGKNVEPITWETEEFKSIKESLALMKFELDEIKKHIHQTE